MQHHLSVDLETYSGVSIGKAGAHKYIQSPDFEILLCAYSLDGAPVEFIDLAQGEALPQWLVSALADPAYIKHAYNAAFEIGCLSKALGPLPLDQWRCTMLHALYCGYPAGLEAAGRALGLPADKQKLAAGRALIRYFCMPCAPSKANGGRTRNLPRHDPAKWRLFKDYCAGDVVTEMEILGRLSNFPVPAEVQRQWETDQRINGRGVAVDMELVQGALHIGEATRQRLMEEAVGLSGLPNPNSVGQLTKWLEGELDEGLTDLRKDTVARLLGGWIASDTARRMLEIRQELGKTSTKKYNAIQAAVCADGRCRGLLQFYGANRTGRWCLTGDHEVLTPGGWVRLDQWRGGEIACWAAPTEYISFQKATALAFDYDGEMYSIAGQRCEQVCTPEHRMAVLQKDGRWGTYTMESLGQHRFTIPFTGRRPAVYSPSDNAIRVLVMVQADGHYTNEGNIRLHFKKQRKLERCKKLLRESSIPFAAFPRADDTADIVIKNRCMPLWLRQFSDKTFGYWLLDEPPEVIFDELQYWDGYRCGPNSIQYVTTNKQNADVLQAAAVLSGRSATMLSKTRGEEAWSKAYILNIWNAPGHGTSIRREQISKTRHTGKVYCAETPTGYFVVRRHGKVWITGNSGRLVQVQNLPRTYIGPLPLARGLVKGRETAKLRALYGPVPDTLSQLIRTSFVAAPGHILVDADFSSIEARVISWLAGEEWRLAVFRTHGKIYEASASQMFGVPLERITKGNPEYALRQKGKIAELALGYQGGAGALIKMGALDMGLTEEELPEIVRRWRDANKRIRNLWYAMEAAAVAAIRDGAPAGLRGLLLAREVDHGNGLDFLTIRLPSGRKLFYANPSLGVNQWGNPSILYKGMDQATRKWKQVETYGGKLVENVVQAIARDCLAEAIERLEAQAYPVVFHVHDEVVIECAPGRAGLGRVAALMSQPPPWAPGLPLGADGWVGEFYKKD